MVSFEPESSIQGACDNRRIVAMCNLIEKIEALLCSNSIFPSLTDEPRVKEEDICLIFI